METGNLAMYQGVPIIFVRKGMLKVNFDDQITIQGINGITNQSAKKVKHIFIDHKPARACYIMESSTLKEFDCLLNRALLIEGV